MLFLCGELSRLLVSGAGVEGYHIIRIRHANYLRVNFVLGLFWVGEGEGERMGGGYMWEEGELLSNGRRVFFGFVSNNLNLSESILVRKGGGLEIGLRLCGYRLYLDLIMFFHHKRLDCKI